MSFLRPPELYGHLHVDVHEKTDIPLITAQRGAAQGRELHGLYVRLPRTASLHAVTLSTVGRRRCKSLRRSVALLGSKALHRWCLLRRGTSSRLSARRWSRLRSRRWLQETDNLHHQGQSKDLRELRRGLILDG